MAIPRYDVWRMGMETSSMSFMFKSHNSTSDHLSRILLLKTQPLTERCLFQLSLKVTKRQSLLVQVIMNITPCIFLLAMYIIMCVMHTEMHLPSWGSFLSLNVSWSCFCEISFPFSPSLFPFPFLM